MKVTSISFLNSTNSLYLLSNSEYFSDNYPKLTKFSRFIQKALWYIGIAVYNPITGEDTPDFNNTGKIKNSRFAFIRYNKNIINTYI